MTARRHPDRTRRHTAWLMLLVAALLARMAAPDGWMPVANAAGGIEIALCNGMAGDSMVLTPDGKLHHKTPQKGQAGDHPCAFAGLGVADAPPPLPQVAITAPPAIGAPIVIHADALPGRGLAAPPPPATGPPARA